MRRYTSAWMLGLLTVGTGLAQQPMSDDSMQMLPEVVHVAPEMESGSDAVSLADLEAMALSNNPTLRQAHAQVEAAQGAALQAGLKPNPFVGYVAEQIGVQGTAGELQGGFVSQEFVRGNKLGLSRAKYCQRAQIAMTNLHAQRQRVKNDVATHFYQTLAAQRRIELHQQQVETAADNVQTYKEMLNMGQLGQAEVLQAEVELRRANLNQKRAVNDLEQELRNLTSFVGVPGLNLTRVEGILEILDSPLPWETALDQLLSTSPQLTAARQKIHHDEIVIRRERAEPIPNVTVDFTVGYNVEADNTVAGIAAGLPLPVFNRNQGTLRQARADLNRSYAELMRMELDLRNGLAKQYRDYVSAWQHVQEYDQTMIPKSQEAVDLLEKSYRDRRAAWTSVLGAKRMLLDLQSEQIDNLLSYHMADISIRGNLLMGGLTEPDAPMSGGHIDANNQPR